MSRGNREGLARDPISGTATQCYQCPPYLSSNSGTRGLRVLSGKSAPLIMLKQRTLRAEATA